MITKKFLFYYKCLLCYGLLVLLALGAAVRAMEAGLACPDWPLCFGQIFPQFHPQVYIELIHRFAAGLLAVSAFILNGSLLRSKNSSLVSSKVKLLCWFSFVVLVLQIFMGALTVWLKLHSHVVTTHLALALTLFCLFFWIFWSIKKNLFLQEKRTLDKENQNKKKQNKAGEDIEKDTKDTTQGEGFYEQKKSFSVQCPVVLLFLLVVFQVLLGGMVASNNAGLVCPGFPLCHGEWFPTFKGPIGLQVLHRLMAYILTFFVSMFTLWVYLSPSFSRLKKLSLMLLSMLFLQIGIGIANVLLLTPVILTVSHSVVAAMMIMTVLKMLFEISHSFSLSVVDD